MNARACGILVIAGLGTLSACVLNAPAQPQPAPPPPGHMLRDPVPQLSVRGEAEIDKPADQMNLSLGVVTQATEAAQAMEENSRKMNDIIAAITRAGLTEKEYRTGRFNVQPQYGPPPRNPQPDWRPQIVGYQVTNTLQIKTQKIEKAGEIIEAATKAGANSVDSIHFDLADRRKHRAEAIRVATENAIADANALANASHQKLVRVLSISLDSDTPMPVYRQGMEMMRGVAADMEMAPPITAGDITVRASVTVVYEIQGVQ